MGIIQQAQIFVLLWAIGVGGMYFLSYRKGGPVAIPGDLLIQRGTRRIYFPSASSVVFAIVMFFILKTFGL